MEKQELTSYERRMKCEEDELRKELNLPNNQSVITEFQRIGEQFQITFVTNDGSLYTIQTNISANSGYPFKQPNFYFIGNVPKHRFYKQCEDVVQGSRKTTNLSHTDFGLFYGTYSPRIKLVDWVKRIIYSMTQEGEIEMNGFMSSRQ